MATYLTADHHFGHAKIIGYCNRSFDTVEEMDAAMIERWNARVSSSDTVVHLGDFALASRERSAELLGVLNGYKVLLLGNHDRSRTAMLDCGFSEVFKGEYVLDGLRCVHDPADARPGETTLAGHVHAAWTEDARTDGTRIINVGVDVRGFAPVLVDEVLGAER